MTSLSGRTIIMSGGSRGIGLAIARRAAADGANVTLIAKTDQPDPRLNGTIHTAADEIRDMGGEALPIVGDVRDDAVIDAAVEATVERFGGIDIVVNNASVLNLSGTETIEPKRYDLMQDVNVRGTFMLTRAAIPYLRKSDAASVLTLSPPINLDPAWLGAHPAYTMAKYGMTLAALGFAHELAEARIVSNCLWPRTLIATDAVGNMLGGDEALRVSRKAEIVADAAYVILTSRDRTGQTLVDDEVLAAAGITDLEKYRAFDGDSELALDIFL